MSASQPPESTSTYTRQLYLTAAHATIVPAYHRLISWPSDITAEQLCTVIQLSEFQISVAIDARIRSYSARIAVGKAINDLAVKFLREIKDILPHSEPQRNAASILRIFKSTAGMRT